MQEKRGTRRLGLTNTTPNNDHVQTDSERSDERSEQHHRPLLLLSHDACLLCSIVQREAPFLVQRVRHLSALYVSSVAVSCRDPDVLDHSELKSSG